MKPLFLDLSPRTNTYRTPPNRWVWILEVCALGIVGYVLLILMMV